MKDSAGTGETPVPSALGPYQLILHAIHGGIADFYLAEDTRSGRRVTLKVIRAVPPNARIEASFRRQAGIAARLDHPGIPKFYEAGEHEGVFYIAMQPEVVEARPLTEAIVRSMDSGESDGRRVERSVRIVEQVARALHAAHESGVIHRGLTPASIWITEDGHPLIIDFGETPEEEGPGSLRLVELVNARYLAPEACEGWTGTDRRLDVYALGVTLYQSLTSRPPFGEKTADVLRAIRHDRLDPRRWNGAVSRDLHAVVETATAKDPDLRYRTALEFAEALRRVRERPPSLTGPVGLVRRIWMWARRRPRPQRRGRQ